MIHPMIRRVVHCTARSLAIPVSRHAVKQGGDHRQPQGWVTRSTLEARNRAGVPLYSGTARYA